MLVRGAEEKKIVYSVGSERTSRKGIWRDATSAKTQICSTSLVNSTQCVLGSPDASLPCQQTPTLTKTSASSTSNNQHSKTPSTRTHSRLKSKSSVISAKLLTRRRSTCVRWSIANIGLTSRKSTPSVSSRSSKIKNTPVRSRQHDSSIIKCRLTHWFFSFFFRLQNFRSRSFVTFKTVLRG